jgi:hypothetical protein
MSRLAGERLVLRPIIPALRRYPVDIAYREGASKAAMAFVEDPPNTASLKRKRA